MDKRYIYICCSPKDYMTVRPIVAALRAAGYTVWLPGEFFCAVPPNINNIIEGASVTLFFSSINTKTASYAEWGVRTAFNMGKPIIQIRLDDTPYHIPAGNIWGKVEPLDYRTNPQKSVDNLLTAVGTYCDWHPTGAGDCCAAPKTSDAGNNADYYRVDLGTSAIAAGCTDSDDGCSATITERRSTYLPHCVQNEHLRDITLSIKSLERRIAAERDFAQKKALDFQENISEAKEQIRDLEGKKMAVLLRNHKGALQQGWEFLVCLAGFLKFPARKPERAARATQEELEAYQAKIDQLNDQIKALNRELNQWHHYSESISSSLKEELHELSRAREEALSASEVYSSVFAPAEIKRKSHLQVHVYLHLYEDSEQVKTYAKEAVKNAERRDYAPLQMKLKEGDRVDVELNIYGETRLMNARKVVLWQNRLSKCSFDYLVPADIYMKELSCEINLYVNGALIGDMRFITLIAENPVCLNPEILSHTYKKIFISYAHQDEKQVKHLALAYKAQGIDYFYDRDKLEAGDVYEEEIYKNIDSSDLFILCWSENAAKSSYVAKEKERALGHAYPQLSRDKATLKIYPVSMEPYAELPADMKDIYNFERL